MTEGPAGFIHHRYRTVPPAVTAGQETVRHRVVICGGGPVGLAMALALARRGIASVILEADDTVCIGSRAICLSRRTLEILDRLGVLRPFLEKGLPWTGGRSFYRDSQVLHFRMPHDAQARLAPMTNLQQYYIEQFLLDAVLRQPETIALRWSSRVTDVVQGDDGIAVAVEAGGLSYQMQADYLIACDGARSPVRQSLGLKMAGTAYEGRYVIADIEIALDWPAERLAWFDPPSAPGRTLLMHKQPDNLWRIDYQLHAEEDAEAMIRPENVAPVIAAHLAMLGVSLPWKMVWISLYRATAVSLAAYRHRRVLFAGDAAHLVPIFGVRGLNSGFDDAFNLAWKLGYVLDGVAPDTLLDSYSAERRFAWEVNVAQAMKSTEFMAPPSRGFAVMRDAALSLARAHPALAALINPRQSSAIGYSASVLNTPIEETAFAVGPAPGEAIPEMPVTDAASATAFLTTLPGAHFTLLAFCEGGAWPDAVAEMARTGQAMTPPVGVIGICMPGTPEPARPLPAPGRDVRDHTGQAARLFDARDGTAYLLRPDGHVCARGRRMTVEGVRMAIRAALGEVYETETRR